MLFDINAYWKVMSKLVSVKRAVFPGFEIVTISTDFPSLPSLHFTDWDNWIYITDIVVLVWQWSSDRVWWRWPTKQTIWIKVMSDRLFLSFSFCFVLWHLHVFSLFIYLFVLTHIDTLPLSLICRCPSNRGFGFVQRCSSRTVSRRWGNFEWRLSRFRGIQSSRFLILCPLAETVLCIERLKCISGALWYGCEEHRRRKR